MANVLQPQIEFHPRPVAHAPSPFGFGFGLTAAASSAMVATGWHTPGHTNPSAFQHLASSVHQASNTRSQKRRHENEDESESVRYPGARDDSMDRSPTPERPKRAAPKRARITPLVDLSVNNSKTTKENKSSGDSNDVDVGVLLGKRILPSHLSCYSFSPL